MDLKQWHSQLRKGSTELVVLALLAAGELYGSELLDKARSLGDLLTEGALYPLLNRLEREGKLVARWSATGSGGHPRKYYRLTPTGETRFAAIRTRLIEFIRAVDRLLEEVENERSDAAARRALSSKAC